MGAWLGDRGQTRLCSYIEVARNDFRLVKRSVVFGGAECEVLDAD